MKKSIISFSILLFLIILSVSIFIVLIDKDKKARQEAAKEASNPQVTITPTEAVTPTVMPEPTEAPVIIELYPAYQTVNNETKYGYIDKSGTFVIEPTFDTASDFHDGVAVVTLNGQYLVINGRGVVVYADNAPIEDYSNGMAVFTDRSKENTLYGYIDTKGKVIIDAKYEKASDFLEDNTAYVSVGEGKYDLIDKTGSVLESYTVDAKYDKTGGLYDGYLIYSDSENYGVVNLKGEEILKPIYSNIRYLGYGLFAVKEPGLEVYEVNDGAMEAIFNQTGEQLTDYCLYDVGVYENGYSSATDDTSTFFIGLDGKRVSDLPDFDGRGTLKLSGDVIEAIIDGQLIYCSTNKLIFWQIDDTITLSDSIYVETIKFKPNRDVLVKYPQIEGLADQTIQDNINLALESIFIDSRKTLKKEDATSIDDSFSATLINNLLIIEKTGYDYPFGAAHGMPIMNYYYIDIITGVFYQFKDLFIEGSDYVTKINKMITAEIAIDATSPEPKYFPDGFKGIAEIPYFKLDMDSITIYFYPYDIAPYAAGFPEFMIPFDDIMEYINLEGAFWNSLNGTIPPITVN